MRLPFTGSVSECSMPPSVRISACRPSALPSACNSDFTAIRELSESTRCIIAAAVSHLHAVLRIMHAFS